MRADSWANELITPERKLHDVLAATFVIRSGMLTSEARLVEDLNIDGQDADLLFSALSEATHTDFSALYENWSLYFRTRDEVLRDDLNKAGVIALTILLTIIATWHGNPLGGALMAAGGFVAPNRRQPIRIGQIVSAIERRYWA